jgi:hypothetical protein
VANLKVNKCGDCGTRIVIMNTQTGRKLPVEVEDGKVFDEDDIFNYKIHKSHLIKCVPLRLRWGKVQYDFFKKEKAKLKLSLKDLLR